MLIKGNKIYRNLQEQVGENQKNIEELQSLIGVGINVKYLVDTIADLSDIEDPEDGSFAAVGMAKPYSLYLFKGNVWIDFGLFPSPGPQGTPGTNGTNGTNGEDAGFGSITTTTTTTSPENPAAVNVETSGPNTAKNIKFNFTIPKGDKGERGQRGYKGEAAGFGTPTASVDSNVGTPSVVVTASGSDTAKVFDFAFSNLKGEQGEQGEPGQPGQDAPTLYRHSLYIDFIDPDNSDLYGSIFLILINNSSVSIDSFASLYSSLPLSYYSVSGILSDDVNGTNYPLLNLYAHNNVIEIGYIDATNGWDQKQADDTWFDTISDVVTQL